MAHKSQPSYSEQERIMCARGVWELSQAPRSLVPKQPIRSPRLWFHHRICFCDSSLSHGYKKHSAFCVYMYVCVCQRTTHFPLLYEVNHRPSLGLTTDLIFPTSFPQDMTKRKRTFEDFFTFCSFVLAYEEQLVSTFHTYTTVYMLS